MCGVQMTMPLYYCYRQSISGSENAQSCLASDAASAMLNSASVSPVEDTIGMSCGGGGGDQMSDFQPARVRPTMTSLCRLI